MIDSRDWEASYTVDERGTGGIRVSGRCIVPTSGWGGELRRHEPQRDDDELLLDLVLSRPTGPVLQVISSLSVTFEEAPARRYERVSILPDGPHDLPVHEASDAGRS
jgi:hypothetical protein